jgi:hypothetical protein
MKRVSTILLMLLLASPVALSARSNHAGWHGAAPVKRNHHGKRTLSGVPQGAFYGM